MCPEYTVQNISIIGGPCSYFRFKKNRRKEGRRRRKKGGSWRKKD